MKVKVKEKAKAFTPKQQSVNVLRPVGEGVKAFFENHLTCARTRARENPPFAVCILQLVQRTQQTPFAAIGLPQHPDQQQRSRHIESQLLRCIHG